MDLRLPKLNKVLISGFIANDLEIRYTPKGKPVLRFAVSVDKSYKDEFGNWQKQTSFVDVVAWDKWAEAVHNNCHKGSPVIVEGRIDTRTYTDNNNVSRKVVEIIADHIQYLETKPKQDAVPDEDEEPPLPADEDIQSPITNDDVPF